MAASILSFCARPGCCEMTTLAPRLFSSATSALLSNALSAISPSKAMPSISGGTSTLSALARHQPEAHQIAQCVGQRENLGGHAAFGATDGLALSPPFAP